MSPRLHRKLHFSPQGKVAVELNLPIHLTPYFEINTASQSNAGWISIKSVNVWTLPVTLTCYQFLAFLWSLSSNPTRCCLQFITKLSHVRLDSIILSAIRNHIRLFRIILAPFHKIKIEDIIYSRKIMAILIVTIIWINTEIMLLFTIINSETLFLLHCFASMLHYISANVQIFASK